MKRGGTWARFLLIFLATLGFTRAGLMVGAQPAEECRTRIENRVGGAITVSNDLGVSWRRIGTVIRPNEGGTAETDDFGFTAADQAPAGSVAACAVNALHVKVRQGVKHAVLFTIQPAGFLGRTEAEVRSYFSGSTSIFTDLPPGRGLFGAEFSPRVGNPVLLERRGLAASLPSDYRPTIGDVLVLPSFRPGTGLREIHWTNRVGGLVRGEFADRSARAVGLVERPVGAVGRFGGSEFAGRGEVRANHPGVLCVSTSPVGSVGGFQVVPSVHAREPCLDYVWGAVAAWMVVRPLPGQPPLEGREPLFSGQIRPATGRCEVRYGLGPWQLVPERVGLVPDGLHGVSEVRIRFAP